MTSRLKDELIEKRAQYFILETGSCVDLERMELNRLSDSPSWEFHFIFKDPRTSSKDGFPHEIAPQRQK